MRTCRVASRETIVRLTGLSVVVTETDWHGHATSSEGRCSSNFSRSKEFRPRNVGHTVCTADSSAREQPAERADRGGGGCVDTRGGSRRGAGDRHRYRSRSLHRPHVLVACRRTVAASALESVPVVVVAATRLGVGRLRNAIRLHCRGGLCSWTVDDPPGPAPSLAAALRDVRIEHRDAARETHGHRAVAGSHAAMVARSPDPGDSVFDVDRAASDCRVPLRLPGTVYDSAMC